MSPQRARLMPCLRLGMIILSAAGIAGCAAVRSGQPDARLVFCLAPAKRSGLIAAAGALGVVRSSHTADHVVVDGQQMSIETWRRARKADFDRSCAALVGAAQLPQQGPAGGNSGPLAALDVLLPVVAGGALTLFGGAWQARAINAKVESTEMRAAARGYVRSAETHARKWLAWSGTRPDARPLYERHGDLEAQLRRCGVLHPRWRPIRPLLHRLAVLTGAVTGESQAQGWPFIPPEERERRVAELLPQLAQFEAEMGAVASALERPWRIHRTMRASWAESAAPRDPAVPGPLPPPASGDTR